MAKKLKTVTSISLSTEKQVEVAKSLFPAHTEIEWAKLTVEQVPLFTLEELIAAAKKFKVKKASGPDGITPEVVEAVVQDHPEKCLSAMNSVLQSGIFPKEWKIARLVRLEKEKKADQGHQGYRPISLLNVLGKLLEQLLLSRLKAEIETTGGLLLISMASERAGPR